MSPVARRFEALVWSMKSFLDMLARAAEMTAEARLQRSRGALVRNVSRGAA
jgi:hypothetical protein